MDWALFHQHFNNYNNTFNLVQDSLTFKQNNPYPPSDHKDLIAYNKQIGLANMSIGALGIAEHTLGSFIKKYGEDAISNRQLVITLIYMEQALSS